MHKEIVPFHGVVSPSLSCASKGSQNHVLTRRDKPSRT